MAEPIKFTKEELEGLEKIQQSYIEVQADLGQVSIAKLKLEEQLSSITKSEEEIKGRFRETQQMEQNFIGEISKKYGEGTLNPESGVFTPNK